MKNLFLYILPFLFIFSEYHSTKSERYTTLEGVLSIYFSEFANKADSNSDQAIPVEEEEEVFEEKKDREELHHKMTYRHFMPNNNFIWVKYFLQPISRPITWKKLVYFVCKIPFYILFLSLKIAF